MCLLLFLTLFIVGNVPLLKIFMMANVHDLPLEDFCIFLCIYISHVHRAHIEISSYDDILFLFQT